MIAARELTSIELDPRASEPTEPYGIITVDCSSPKEYDDGIAVEALPSAEELYRVSVFAVDTSPLYQDGSIMKRVLTRTESKYHNPRTGAETYEPMLDEGLTQRMHFLQGNVRKALAVTFLVGAKQAPTDVNISFGKVEVRRNYNYNDFGRKCRYSDTFKPFGRAAALVLAHLNSEYAGEEEAYRGLIHVPKTETWKRGSNINQAYMVATNHLVGRLMRDEDRLAIYRTHDIDDGAFAELMSPRVARFSITPGVHDGLRLDPYARVTSPLRRGEDFIMHGLLKARDVNRPLTSWDQRVTASMVQRLNQRIAAELFHGRPRTQSDDLWAPGQRPMSQAS